jgi:type IV secretory pathway VirB9-like protein
MKRTLLFAWVLTLFLTPVLGFAEDAKPEPDGKPVETPDSNLKERQAFNKLRRSTRNIYKVTMRSGVAYRLQTALGYVSTIDLPEPALKVFVGDQDLFKVEVYERQVLVKPVTDDAEARTNIIIITESGRLAFDVSMGAPETADFVLDYRLPKDDESLVQNAFEKKVEEKAAVIKEDYQQKEAKLEEKAEKLSEDKLKEKVAAGVQSFTLKGSEAKGEVQVNLLSLSRMADKGYLRFSILNYSKVPYKLLKVSVGAIEYERKLLKTQESGNIEFPSELEISKVIQPDSYVYGVIVFDYRVLGKGQKPVLRVFEDALEPGSARDIELKGFRWFE